MTGKERIFYIPSGASTKLVLGDGSTVTISHTPKPNSSGIDGASISREEMRETLKAQYPSVLFPYVQARLDQHASELVGGEQNSHEMTTSEKEEGLTQWMEHAKSSGISNREALKLTGEIFEGISAGSVHNDVMSPVVKGIKTEVSDLIKNTWSSEKAILGNK